MADIMSDEELRLGTLAPDFPATATLPMPPVIARPARDRQERSRPSTCKPVMSQDWMLNGTSRSRGPTCPKCRCPAGLVLRARLREADGFPEVQCFECWACGEVVVVERGLSEEPRRPRGLLSNSLPMTRRPSSSQPHGRLTRRSRGAIERDVAGMAHV